MRHIGGWIDPPSDGYRAPSFASPIPHTPQQKAERSHEREQKAERSMAQKRLPRPKRGAEHTTVILASPSQDGHTSPTSSARPDTTEESLRALEARHQALVLATGQI